MIYTYCQVDPRTTHRHRMRWRVSPLSIQKQIMTAATRKSKLASCGQMDLGARCVTGRRTDQIRRISTGHGATREAQGSQKPRLVVAAMQLRLLEQSLRVRKEMEQKNKTKGIQRLHGIKTANGKLADNRDKAGDQPLRPLVRWRNLPLGTGPQLQLVRRAETRLSLSQLSTRRLRPLRRRLLKLPKR